jgi:hypothetical protein
LLLRCIRSFFHLSCATDFGRHVRSRRRPGGCFRRTEGFLIPPTSYLKFRPLVAAVLLQIEDRDTFVVGRSLQDIRMA